MNSEKESFFLSMEQVCVTLDASPSSRNFIEGEAILKSRHLILCEASKRTEFKVHVYALYLQTSTLDSPPPHTVEAVLKINRKKYASADAFHVPAKLERVADVNVGLRLYCLVIGCIGLI
jgi:hypothetical protein